MLVISGHYTATYPFMSDNFYLSFQAHLVYQLPLATCWQLLILHIIGDKRSSHTLCSRGILYVSSILTLITWYHRSLSELLLQTQTLGL